MKITTLLSVALAAAALPGVVTSAASAAPSADRGDYITRAVPSSPNGKDVFRRIVKAPRHKPTAENRDCPMQPAHCVKPNATEPEAQG